MSCLSPGMQHHMQQQSQPIVQPLSSPVDHTALLLQHQQQQQSSNPSANNNNNSMITSPCNTLGRSVAGGQSLMHHHQQAMGSPMSSAGTVFGNVMASSPANTLCNPGIPPLPPNGCPGNGYAGNVLPNITQCGTMNNSYNTSNRSSNNAEDFIGFQENSTRVSPEGREDTPITSDSVPLELASMPSV